MHKFGIILLSLLFSQSLFALSEDKEKPLHVIADAVTVNYEKGITTLQGHVTVTQGSTTLKGNQVIIYTDKQQQLIKLIADGDVNQQASYQTMPTPKSEPFTATANRIIYVKRDKLAIFEGNAHATDGTNQFQGPEFKYWTEKQEVVTEKIANQQSTIIIYPG